jgi:hypothetical protein
MNRGEEPNLANRSELKDFNWEDALVMTIILVLLLGLVLGSLYFAYSSGNASHQ